MVTLFQIPGGWGEPSASPFCVKLECYLRMAEVPFKTEFGDPRKAPRGKVPWIDDDGVVICDSQLAIEHLKKKHGDPLDARLGKEEWARGHVLRRMLEEGTYFLLVHLRWGEDAGWATYKRYFLPLLPPVIGGPVIEMVRRGMKKTLHAQGSGRHTHEQKTKMACEDFNALATALGDADYLFGAEPTSFDATAFAFLTCLLAFPVASEPKAFVEANERLVAYRARIQQRYFKSAPAQP
jgi:glutathione S-transferase